MEIGFPSGLDGESYHAKVKLSTVDRDGISVGVEASNQIIDTRLYDV